MSDWYRSGGDRSQEDWGREEWDRQGRDRAAGRARYGAPRDDTSRSGWRGQGAPRSFADRDYAGGYEFDYDYDYGRNAYGGGSQPYRGGGYGAASSGNPRAGSQAYGGPSYGGQRNDFAAEPEQVRHVSDGDYGRPHMFGRDEGEHRGRGPKNYKRSDERIREDVNERLADDSWIDASGIEVAVADCEVTLTGAVTRREDKRRAEDIVEHVSGVTHVQNNLRVRAQSEQTGPGIGNVSASDGERYGGGSVQ